MPDKILTPQEELDLQYKAQNNARINDILRHNQRVQSSIPTAGAMDSDKPVGLEFGEGTKYDVGIGYDQLGDRAEYNAQQQTTGDKWKNATIKMGGIAGATFINGTLGTALGVVDLVTGGEDGEHEFSDFWNNSINNATTNWTESLEDIQGFPNLKTREEQAIGLGSKLGTANFWADGVLKNAGFAIGTVAAGAVTGGLMSSAMPSKIIGSVADDLVAAGKYATAEEASIAIANGAHTKEVLDGLKLAGQANKHKTTIQGYANTSLASLGEASSEAIGNKNEVYRRLTLEHPSMSEEEKKSISEKAGNATFAWNAAVLGVTNTRQMSSMMSSFDGTKLSLGKIAKNAETGLYKKSISTGLDATKRVATGLVSEGTEEQLQLLGSKASEDYYTRVANGDHEGMQTIVSSIGNGLATAYGTEEGWENFVTGAALGFTGVPTVGKYKNGIIGPKIMRGVYGEIQDAKESGEETDNVVNKVNSIIQSDSFKNRYNNTVASSTYEGDKNKATTEFDFRNAESNQFILDSETFIDAGLYSEFKEQLGSFANTDVNTLRKQFDTNDAYKDLDDNEFKDLVDKQVKTKIQKLDFIRDLKRDINRQFPNASSDYKTQLLQYGAVVNDVESRISSLEDEASKYNDVTKRAIELDAKRLKIESDLKIHQDTHGKTAEKLEEGDYTTTTFTERNDLYRGNDKIAESIQSIEKEMEDLESEMSSLDMKRIEPLKKELEDLYQRRTDFGVKYLNGFGIEFSEKVDSTIAKSREEQANNVKKEQAKKAADKTTAEYNAKNYGGNTTEIDYDADSDNDNNIDDYSEQEPIIESQDTTVEGFGSDKVELVETPIISETSPEIPIVETPIVNKDVTGNSPEVSPKRNPNEMDFNGGTSYGEVTDESVEEKVTPEFENPEPEPEPVIPVKSVVNPKLVETPQAATDASKTIHTEDQYDEVDDYEAKKPIEDEEPIKQVNAANSISVLNQEYKLVGDRFIAISNSLHPSTNIKMLDPTMFPIGTDLTFTVEDEDNHPVYAKGTKATTTWGELKKTLNKEEIDLYIPISIRANGELLGYVHTESFLTPLNVLAANIPESKIELAAIRKSIIAGNTTGTVIERGGGMLKIDKDKQSGKISERSPKGKLSIVEGRLVITVKTPIKDIHARTRRTTVKDSTSGADIRNTIKSAILYFITDKDVTKIDPKLSNDIQKLGESYGLDLRKYEDLCTFLQYYITPNYDNSGKLKEKTLARRAANNIPINYVFGINKNTDASVDFKLVNLSNPHSVIDETFTKRGLFSDLNDKGIERLNAFVGQLDTVLDGLFLNVSNTLLESNKPLSVITTDGKIQTVGKDYDSFLREHNTTMISPFIDESGKEYYVVNPVLKFSVHNKANNSLDAEDTSGSTESIANYLFEDGNGGDFSERPFEPTEDSVNTVKEVASNSIIFGLRTDFQDQVIDSIIGEVGVAFAKDRSNISVVDSSVKVFDTAEKALNNVETILSNPSELAKSKVSKEVLEIRKRQLELMLANKELLTRLAYNRMNQSSLFIEEESDENTPATQKQEFDRASYTENLADKVSIEVKKMFTGIIDLKDGKPITNWFGYKVVIDPNTIYEVIQNILLGSDSNINIMLESLNKRTKAFPWLEQVVTRIAGSEDYIKAQFVKSLTAHANKMAFVQWENKDGVTTHTIMEANDNGVKQVLLKDWNTNLSNSKAFNPITGDSDATYFKALREEYRGWRDSADGKTPDAKTIVNWLSKFGIKTTEETTTRVVADLESAGKNPLLDNDSVIYIMSVYANRASTNTLNLLTNSPLKTSPSVIRLAEETAKDANNIVAKSFRTGGKTVQAAGINSYTINRIRELKRNAELVNSLLKIPFYQNSYWLQELKNDPAFRDTFDYFTMSLDALKEKDSKNNPDGDMTNKNKYEIETVKIAMFQALRKKVRTTLEKGGNTIVSKYANFLLLTTSDKPTVKGVTTKLAPIKIDGNGMPTDETFTFMFDQLIRPEIDRINQIHSFISNKDNKNIEQPNSANYLKAGQLFYFIPSLNDASFIWSDKEAGKLNDNIADPNSDIYKRVMNEHLIPQLKVEVNSKLALWKDAGIGYSTEGNSFPFLDAKYMNDITLNYSDKASEDTLNNRKVRIAAIDMVFQYKVAYANQFFTLYSDPSNYYKNNEDNSWDNITKRLAGSAAPRMEFQHMNPNIKYMFVVDPKSSSLISEDLKKLLDEKDAKQYSGIKEADAQEWITLTEKIGNMQANGDIKTEGLAKLIVDTIKKEVDGGNYFYLDALEKAIESKLGDDALTEYKSFVYQPEKPVYFGAYVDSKVNLEHVLYVKSSAKVLVPNRSTHLDNLRILAEKNGVGRIVTASTATKLGSPKVPVNPWVLDDNKNVKGIDTSLFDKDISESLLTVTRDNWGIQQEKRYDPNAHTVRRFTQAAKNFVNGMLEVGGFVIGDKLMTGEQVREHYNKINGEIYRNQYDRVIQELDAKVLPDGTVISINIDKIRDMLIEEGISKGFNTMELETFILDKNLSGIVFAPNSAKIEPLLNSIVENRILKIDMFGKAFTLSAETMLNDLGTGSDIVLTDNYEGKLMPSRVVKENSIEELAFWLDTLTKECD